MTTPMERRTTWSRIVGIERRSAPMQALNGGALPDPTRLEDEEFQRPQKQPKPEKGIAKGQPER